MKYFNFIALILISCTIMFTSCEKNPDNPISGNPIGGAGGYEIFNVILWAGQTIPVGYVVGNLDGNTLTVTYTTDIDDGIVESGWKMNDIHFHVAGALDGLPTNKKGNPTVGKFLYKAENLGGITQSDQIIINLSENNITDISTLFFAAHAIVTTTYDGATQKETAWGEGTDFTDDTGSWAMYFTYPE